MLHRAGPSIETVEEAPLWNLRTRHDTSLGYSARRLARPVPCPWPPRRGSRWRWRAELAGIGICTGEGGMLPQEQDANSRYFSELASARFGFGWDKVAKAQAFNLKGGQGAKTGAGGHLPAGPRSPPALRL